MCSGQGCDPDARRPRRCARLRGWGWGGGISGDPGAGGLGSAGATTHMWQGCAVSALAVKRNCKIAL